MKHDFFNIHFELPAEVRKAEKDVNYTIKLIGGPLEYKAYMIEKELRLAEEKSLKDEAFLIKREFFEAIVLGDVQASPEALAHKPVTLESAQQEAFRRVWEAVEREAPMGEFKRDAPLIEKFKRWASKWFNKVF